MPKGLETFQYKNAVLTREGLQVFYNKDGAKKLIIEYIRGNFYDPNYPIFYKTTRPDVVMILDSFGDAGEYYVKEYYVDLNSGKFISLEYSHSQVIEVEDFNGNQYEISFGRINDTCADNSIGGADLTGLELNKKLVYIFNPSIHQGCDSITTYGPPFEHIKTLGLDSNFSKIFFQYDVSNYENLEWVAMRKENLSLNLLDGMIKKENPSSLLLESQF